MDVCRKMTNMLGTAADQRNNKNNDHYEEYNLMINFEETELRLGLPGGSGVSASCSGGEMSSTPNAKNINYSGKRGFSETIDLELNLESKQQQDLNSEITDLLIHSSTTTTTTTTTIIDQNKKMNMNSSSSSSSKQKNHLNIPACSNDPDDKPSASKAQVVGWPPVRSFRKNILTVNQKSNADEEKGNISAAFVKVSMDGAPYLRKVDLKMYKSYPDLSVALGKMFSSFTIGNCGSQGMKDFMNVSKLMDLLNSSEYVPTYEDKDGDWMLVGDVPWAMFVDSCKRLRIMKGSEAIGLAPRAVEKCKNRS